MIYFFPHFGIIFSLSWSLPLSLFSITVNKLIIVSLLELLVNVIVNTDHTGSGECKRIFSYNMQQTNKLRNFYKYVQGICEQATFLHVRQTQQGISRR